jgi:hypothetical protein
MSPLTGAVNLKQVNQLVADYLTPFEANQLNQLGSVGMCRGMCLDWIRRFLLARAPSSTAHSAAAAAAAATPSAATSSRVAYPYKLEEGNLGRRRAAIMRNVHAASDSVPIVNNWSAELNRTFDESDDLYAKAGAYRGNRNLTDAEQAEWRRLGDRRTELLTKYNAGIDEQGAAIERMGSEGRMHPIWNRMRGQLDDAVAKARPDGRASSRPFSALTTLGGEVVDRKTAGTRQACGRAVADAHKHSTTHHGAAAAILSASTGSSEVAGHAVAIVAANPEFYFFDPNFGVYTPKAGKPTNLVLGITAILDAYYDDCSTIDITWFAAA